MRRQAVRAKLLIENHAAGAVERGYHSRCVDKVRYCYLASACPRSWLPRHDEPV